MSDWKDRIERMKIANNDSSKNSIKNKPSKCDRCGRKMSKASRYSACAGSVVCYICNEAKNMGG